MKIIASMITEIDATYDSGGSIPVLTIKADLTARQMERLFTELWEAVGDEGLREWLEPEDYQLIKGETVAA